MKKRRILNIVSVVLILVMIFSGYKIYTILDGYHQEKVIKESFHDFKPTLAKETKPDTEDTDSAPITNEGVQKAQAENPDIVGWLTVDGTNIDYPFVASKDNLDYLRTDLYGNYAVAGTIFMDYQCRPDFSVFNTIIYGHEMKNGSMFGDIAKFSDKEYWDAHTTGYIFLEHETYQLEIFSYAVVDQYDENVYYPLTFRDDPEQFPEYIKSKSRQYRDVTIQPDEKVVTLSTCNYEYDGARAILVAKLLKRS